MLCFFMAPNTPRIFEKPFVLCIGPQRAGTSWIRQYFRDRGDVCLPQDVAEIFYFDRHYERGLDFYRSHFHPSESHKIIMEVSSTAFDNPDAPRRVYETFGGHIRLICPLRHPVMRSYSAYTHYLHYGIVKDDLPESCAQNAQILMGSHYALHLRRWLEYFPLENFHFVYQEELERSAESFARKLCDATSLSYRPPMQGAKSDANTPTYPQAGTITEWAQRLGNALRASGLGFFISMASLLGLQGLIFGRRYKDTRVQEIPVADREWLEARLLPEINELESLIGPIPLWAHMEIGK